MLYLNYITQVDILLKVKAQFPFEFLQISCFMQIFLHTYVLSSSYLLIEFGVFEISFPVKNSEYHFLAIFLTWQGSK
jgi:hypothetical protein